MTQPDRLSREEIQRFADQQRKVTPLQGEMLAQALLDAMLENEQLRHLLARACGIIGRGKCAPEDHIGMQTVLMEGLQAVNPNKDSEHEA